MLSLVQHLDKSVLSPRCYVVGNTDRLGAAKAASVEISAKADGAWSVRTIPRSREVGQSYMTSVWTTLLACFAALMLVWQEAPELVLVNGPGTCIPVCAACWFLRCIGRRSIIVYVESIARVNKLSMSGIVLYKTGLADVVFVQWPELQAKYPGSLYAGRIM